MTPKARAEACAAAISAATRAEHWLGIELVEIAAGHAVMRMSVASHHANGQGVCHGGVIFALADSAFAYACNSRNASTLAQHGTISFVAPAQVGEVLTATACERSLAGRNGICDVRVETASGAVVAEMRGMSRSVRGQWIEE